MRDYNQHNSHEAGGISYHYPKSVRELQSQYVKELGSGMEMGHSALQQTRRKRRGASLAAMMASFMVGVLVVGGSMYIADRNNLFTGGVPAVTEPASSVIANNGSGLATASYSSSNDASSVYEMASPAVVKIANYTEAATGASIMDDPWFRQFFGGMMEQQRGGRGQYGGGGLGEQYEGGGQDGQGGQSEPELQLSGTGTGFIFEESGYILTNQHVIADAKELRITVQGYEEPLLATVVGEWAELDLAVLKVEEPEGGSFPALALGNSDETNIGDWVIAIGNPYGLDQTMTMGILSAKERPITVSDENGVHELTNLLQTDASINPGNSGGPLLNEQGEVIGINTAVNSEAQGIGFAIPTSTIYDVLNQLKSSALL